MDLSVCVCVCVRVCLSRPKKKQAEFHFLAVFSNNFLESDILPIRLHFHDNLWFLILILLELCFSLSLSYPAFQPIMQLNSSSPKCSLTQLKNKVI